MMTTYDMRNGISAAQTTLRNADDVANNLASVLNGRLRQVSPYNLKALKKELRDYNIHTGCWKDK